MTGKRRGAFRSVKGKGKYVKTEKTASEKSEVSTEEVSFAVPSFYASRDLETLSADFVVLEGSKEPTPIIEVGKDDSLIIEEVGKEGAAEESVVESQESYAMYSEWDDDAVSDSDVDDPDYVLTPLVGVSGLEPSQPLSTSASASASVSSSEVALELSPYPVKQAKGRVRVRQPEKWGRNIKKQRKDSGLAYSYVAKSGESKVKEAKKIGPPCNCPWKCFDIIDQEGREILFNNFYSLSSYDMQTAYIQSWVKGALPKRKRTKAAESKKKLTYHYSVKWRGTSQKVCRTAFISIHGLTKRRVQFALDKQTPSGTVIKDRRGINKKVTKISGPELNTFNHCVFARTTTPVQRAPTGSIWRKVGLLGPYTIST